MGDCRHGRIPWKSGRFHVGLAASVRPFRQWTPIDATGIRIKVSNGQMDIDEIEVNTLAGLPAPRLNIVHDGSVVRVSWTSGGGLETAPNVTGPWTCLGFAASPFELPLNAETPVFFRARR